jgi:hypothetical protein
VWADQAVKAAKKKVASKLARVPFIGSLADVSANA